MLKACSRCGKIHDFNFNCKVGKERKYANTPENKLRSKNSWKIKRAYIRERAFNLCEVCRDQGIYNYTDIEIHHIKKLRDDPDGLLQDNNLVALCVFHHKQADSGEISVDYLKELVAKRDGEIK